MAAAITGAHPRFAVTTFLASILHWQCTHCGNRTRVRSGRCIACGACRTLKKRRPEPVASPHVGPDSDASPLAWWSRVHTVQRFSLGLPSVDRVLGGGAAEGSVILLGGSPGIGKSTLLLQGLLSIARQGHRTLYATGEEPAEQVAARAMRLGYTAEEANTGMLHLVEANTVRAIASELEKHGARALVVDSVQVLTAEGLRGAPGSVSQVREVTRQLVAMAQRHRATLFLVGHVTKDGELAGPKTLEHLVDVVAQFDGTRVDPRRTLTTPKNRFGATHEKAVLEMASTGLVEAPDDRRAASVVVALPSGQVVLEVVAKPGLGRRIAVGIELPQLQTALTALWVAHGIGLEQHDVFARLRRSRRSPTSDEMSLLEGPLTHALEAAATGRPCVREQITGAALSLDGEAPTST